jgi:hypothetical protein
VFENDVRLIRFLDFFFLVLGISRLIELGQEIPMGFSMML